MGFVYEDIRKLHLNQLMQLIFFSKSKLDKNWILKMHVNNHFQDIKNCNKLQI